MRISMLAVTGWMLAAATVLAEDAKVAKLDAPPAVGEISPEIAALLSPTGFKVTKEGTQPVCEIWLAKEWPVSGDASATPEILYPFAPGQFIGVARYPKKAADFRDQDIPAGVYVLRYGHQPVDGAHVGTSPTRDFLLLMPAAKDRNPATPDYKTLTGISKETTKTAHPAILSLQRPAEGGGALSIREDMDHGWTIVRFMGKVKQGGSAKEILVELVVVGKSAE